MINVKRKSAMAFLAAALASINMSWAGAEPVIADNEAELLAAPYYNMDLANPADRHSGYNPALTLVNPVQNQGIFGTCWAFAAVSAVESNIYKHMQAEGIAYNVETSPVKYSPWALAWLRSTPPTNLDMSDSRLHPSVPVSEKYMSPFASKVYRGGSSNFDLEFVSALGIWLQRMDTHDRKALIAPADYVAEDVHLDNYFVVNDLGREENIKKAKQMLLEYGAAIMGVSTGNMSQSDVADFYHAKPERINHAVTLIGWDDEYDFSHSGMRVKPKNKGAWILRNSWGTEWGDKGDYYLSYEDKGIEDVVALDMDLHGDCFDYIATHEDSYDGKKYGRPCPVVDIALLGAAAFASSYTAKGNDVIKAVGVYAAGDSMSYTIKVYKDCREVPADGRKPDYEQQGTFGQDGTPAWAGYRTIELAQPVTLTEGQAYTVEMSLIDSDGKARFMVAADAGDIDVEKVKSYINEGNGKWEKVFNKQAGYKHKIFKIASVIQRIYLKHQG